MSTLLNTKEVTKRLRISESTVYRLFRNKKLKALKVGNALRFEEEEINAFIERHREQIEPEVRETRTILTNSPKISFN
jgi:excisionase family DNA binding protein